VQPIYINGLLDFQGVGAEKRGCVEGEGVAGVCVGENVWRVCMCVGAAGVYSAAY